LETTVTRLCAGIAVLYLIALVVPAAQEPAAHRTILDHVYSEAQAKEGQATYQKVCQTCHGEEMLGEDFVPELVGDDFVARWENHTVGEIVDKIVASMPPDRSVVLTPEQAAAVFARILQANEYPAGDAPLTADAETLAQLKIVKREKP
jgi:mono/diheme cytochrome c family protein